MPYRWSLGVVVTFTSFLAGRVLRWGALGTPCRSYRSALLLQQLLHRIRAVALGCRCGLGHRRLGLLGLGLCLLHLGWPPVFEAALDLGHTCGHLGLAEHAEDVQAAVPVRELEAQLRLLPPQA